MNSLEFFVSVPIMGTRDRGKSHHNADITSLIVHRQIEPHVLRHDALDIKTLTAAIPKRSISSLVHTFLVELPVGSILHFGICKINLHIKASASIWWTHASKKATGQVCVVILHKRRKQINSEGFAMNLFSRPSRFLFGKKCGHDMDEWPGRTENIAPKVHKAIGESLCASIL